MAADLQFELKVKKRIRDLVSDARHGSPNLTSASPEQICINFGFEFRRANIGKKLGMLDDQNRAIIVSSRIDWHPRLLFTIYHEIVHHLIEEDAEIIEFYTRALRNAPAAYDAAIERLCDFGAAEFLLPRESVLRAISQYGLSIASIRALVSNQQSSLVATAIQLAEYSPVPCYVAVCRDDNVSPTSKVPRLHIEIAARSDPLKYNWRSGTPIASDHLLSSARSLRKSVSGPSSIDLLPSGKSIPCSFAEADMIGSQTIGIFHFGHLPSKEQMVLPGFGTT